MGEGVTTVALINPRITVSEEGVTYSPWTNGWAVGFRVEHPDRPTVYIYLNPSGGCDTSRVGDSCVFLYHGPDGEPGPNDGPVCYVNMWDKTPEELAEEAEDGYESTTEAEQAEHARRVAGL